MLSSRFFVSCGGALSTGCDYVPHSSFGCVPPLDTSPLALGGRPPRLKPSSEGLGLSPDAWGAPKRGMPTGLEAFLELPVALGSGPATGPTLKTALCHIRTLVGRRINIGTSSEVRIRIFWTSLIYDIWYLYLIQIICTLQWFHVFISNTKNLHTVKWFQDFLIQIICTQLYDFMYSYSILFIFKQTYVVHSISFQTFFDVEFEIVVDSSKFSMLLLYIL